MRILVEFEVGWKPILSKWNVNSFDSTCARLKDVLIFDIGTRTYLFIKIYKWLYYSRPSVSDHLYKAAFFL